METTAAVALSCVDFLHGLVERKQLQHRPHVTPQRPKRGETSVSSASGALGGLPPASLDRASHCPFLSQSLSLGEGQSQPDVVGVSESVTDTEDELSQVVFISQAPPFSCFRGPAGERPSGLRMAEKVAMGLRGEHNLHILSHSIQYATPSMITSVTFCNFAHMNKRVRRASPDREEKGVPKVGTAYKATASYNLLQLEPGPGGPGRLPRT